MSAMPASVARIIGEVAEITGVPIDHILSRRQDPRTYRARAAAMCFVRMLRFPSGRPSLPQIGRWFGRDHTTVLSAIGGLKQKHKLSVDTWLLDEEPINDNIAA